MRGLRGAGTTIVLTTHYMDEAQALADRVAVISGGQIVAEGTPSAIGGVDVALIAGIGALFGMPLPTHWPAIAVALVFGAASFWALGVAVASLIRNAEAAPAVVQLVLLPLVFISGTYMPIHSAVLNRIAGALPVRPVQPGPARPVRPAQRVRLEGPRRAGRLGAVGVLVAIRRFRWDPRPQ